MVGILLSLSQENLSSLAMQGRYYNNLWTAIDLDIERLENSIADLQESLTSLAKVVLQK